MSAANERISSPELAVRKLIDHAAAEKLEISYRTAGSGLQTTTCYLSSDGVRSATGRGKGVGPQSMASALFEAFEHYHHQYENTSEKLRSVVFHADNLNEELGGGSPDFGLIFGHRPAELSCLYFQSLAGKEAPFAFPAILLNPAFEPQSAKERALIEQTRFYRYSTNSGTAAGQDADEAVLHGLLEIIERDAVGLALIETVLSPNPKAVRAIKIDTLAERCRWIASEIIRETKGELKVWDITSDIGVPAVLCALSASSQFIYRFFGSGASLSSEYAVERAMLEALQGYHIQFSLGEPLQAPLKRSVGRMTLFQRCALSAGYFEYRGGTTDINACDVGFGGRTSSEMALGNQIEFLVNALGKRGINCYWRSIYLGGLAVVQVIAPRLERMYLISHGIPIAAGGRGRAAKRATL